MGMFDDLDTDINSGRERMTSEEIRNRAHVVNGGENMFLCPACGGSGVFRSRYGNVVGKCFKCNGTKRVTKGVAAAAKGMKTRKANWAAYVVSMVAEIEFLRKAADWSSFAAKMCENIRDEQKWSDKQLAAIRNMMAKDEERKAERIKQLEQEKKDRERAVDLTAIQALFDRAVDNEIKKPIFRTEGLTISKAPMNGRNAGALYVIRNDEYKTYLGTLRDGKFQPRREATQADIDNLCAVALDPTAESIKYARRFGRCGCCGHSLVDPISILAGIGPICADKWGLDYFREMARDEYEEMKAKERGQEAMKI